MQTPWGRRFAERFTPADRSEAQRRGLNVLWQAGIVLLVILGAIWLAQLPYTG